MKKLIFPNANINSKNISKSKIKVLILYGNNKSQIYKYTDNDGDVRYTGYFWDIWILLKEKLKDKYDFEESFNNINDINYDIIIDNTYNGIYDIVIDGFNHLNKYEKKITYTFPLLLNSPVIIHEKKNFINMLNDILFSSNFKFIIKIFIFLIIFGIITGIILLIFDPTRAVKLNEYKVTKNKSKYTIVRSIMTGISSIFGETGYLTENITNNYFSLFLTILLLVFGTIITIYYQSYLQSVFLSNIQNREYSEINIPLKECLAYKNDFYSNKLLKYGLKVKYIDSNVPLYDSIKNYSNNITLYGGLVSNYIDTYEFVSKSDNLIISKNFNNDPLSFIINQNYTHFIEDINSNISYLRENLVIRNICNKYYSNYDEFICSLT